VKHAREDYNRIQDPANLIPEDEPVFLLRAQDTLALDAVRSWLRSAERAGVDEKFIAQVEKHYETMLEWRHKHGAKLPDAPIEEDNTNN
jgi:hypothetical protein